MELWEVATVLGMEGEPPRSNQAADAATWGTDPQAQAAMRAMMDAMPRRSRP